MDTCNSCTDLRCEGKNYLTAYLAMWGLEAQMSARSLGPDHGLYIVLQYRSRQWLQQRHSPLRNVNHFNEYKQVSLTDTLVLAGLNSRKVVSVSLAPSINEPLALLGGWIEEEAWKVTKTGSTSRRKITHWERKTKWKNYSIKYSHTWSLGERNGALPRALASHRCGSNYIPKLSSVLRFSLIGYFFLTLMCVCQWMSI